MIYTVDFAKYSNVSTAGAPHDEMRLVSFAQASCRRAPRVEKFESTADEMHRIKTRRRHETNTHKTNIVVTLEFIIKSNRRHETTRENKA